MGTLLVMRSMFHLNVGQFKFIMLHPYKYMMSFRSAPSCFDPRFFRKRRAYRKNMMVLYVCMYHLHQLDPIHMFAMMLHGE